MDVLTFTRALAVIGLACAVIGIATRLRAILQRPHRPDRSRPRGSARLGILYAFTLGMAPWEKESGRIHWLAYLRGVLFHVGVFTAFGVLFGSPWLDGLSGVVLWLAVILTAAAGLAGAGGVIARLTDRNLRALSVPDDYFSVALTALFAAVACGALLWRPLLPLFYVCSAALLAYVPWSKIRHCVYFFYSKFFFGASFGRRGVIGQFRGE